MRVIFVTITFDPEPGALRGLPLAKWLARRGYDVRVLTAFPQYPAGRLYPGYRMRPWLRETMDGIPVLRVPIYPSHDTNPLRRVGTYLSFMMSSATLGTALIGPADVVYLYEPPPTNGLTSLLLRVFRGTPIVHHIADMWPDTVLSSGMLPGRRWVHRTAEYLLGAWCRMMYRSASVMTVLSPGFKRLLVERGVPADKVEVIYNWTDEDVFRPVPRSDALARELGMEGRFNILYAGNIGPLQGLSSLVRAAVFLREHPDILITVIGTGPQEAQVKQLAGELGVGASLQFLARRDYKELPDINALADVLLVHLRDFDFLAATIPSKTQVSLASGRPVLMSVRGDAADLITRADAGVVCPPEDPRALADAMIALARTPRERLEQMGQNGRRYYEEHLSLDTAGEQMDRVLRRAAAMRRG